MCGKCKSLIECPPGEKRVQVIRHYKESDDRFANTYMVVEKSDTNITDAYIITEIAVGNSYSNIPFDIIFCPFCGRYLRGLRYGGKINHDDS